ncbi:MFS transporter [Brevundimonas sp.]|uniref:MFS transporter n=1 Tax=Brevundimonas sp. TaxID=1871086 RepID=UPI002FC8AC61
MTSPASIGRWMRDPLIRSIVVGSIIVSAAAGARQTFGLFVEPFSSVRGLPVTEVAFAIALHNLVWGFAQPVAGAASDRFGPGPVIAFGAITYGLGLTLSALMPSGPMLVVGMGVLVGIGISCSSFGVVTAAVGSAAPPEKRSMALGLASAGGSVGQVALVPLVQRIMEAGGIGGALLFLAACIFAAAPLGFFLFRSPTEPVSRNSREAGDLKKVSRQALGNRGFVQLTLSFFTCGFQLAFIATHLPAYLALCHIPQASAGAALALIGLFNIAGSWACGWLGSRFPQQQILGWLYLMRSVAILSFFMLPKSEISVLAFASVMGLTWLGTVPLTSGLVARMFGVRHLGALFGVCFLAHQIGSFLGAWSGGYIFDLTGSYVTIWTATFLLGLTAAALCFGIADGRPAPTRAMA